MSVHMIWFVLYCPGRTVHFFRFAAPDNLNNEKNMSRVGRNCPFFRLDSSPAHRHERRVLFLFAVTEVAGITEAWDDIGVASQFFVYCSHPEGHLVGREMLLEVLHGICT